MTAHILSPFAWRSRPARGRHRLHTPTVVQRARRRWADRTVPLSIHADLAARWEETDRRRDRQTVGCALAILVGGALSIAIPFLGTWLGWF